MSQFCKCACHWMFDWLAAAFTDCVRPGNVDLLKGTAGRADVNLFLVQTTVYFLGIETKRRGESIKRGQLETFWALAAQQNWDVVILYGNRDEPVEWWHVVPGQQPKPIATSRAEILQWASDWWSRRRAERAA